MMQKAIFASGTAKVQNIGSNADGSKKKMIYLPKSVINFLKLNKGHTLGFNMWIQQETESSAKKIEQGKKIDRTKSMFNHKWKKEYEEMKVTNPNMAEIFKKGKESEADG